MEAQGLHRKGDRSVSEHTFMGEFRQVIAKESIEVYEDSIHALPGDHVFELDGPDKIAFVCSHEQYERLFAPKKPSHKRSR